MMSKGKFVSAIAGIIILGVLTFSGVSLYAAGTISTGDLGWHKVLEIKGSNGNILSGSEELLLKALQEGGDIKVVQKVDDAFQQTRSTICQFSNAGYTEAKQFFFECDGATRIEGWTIEEYHIISRYIHYLHNYSNDSVNISVVDKRYEGNGQGTFSSWSSYGTILSIYVK